MATPMLSLTVSMRYPYGYEDGYAAAKGDTGETSRRAVCQVSRTRGLEPASLESREPRPTTGRVQMKLGRLTMPQRVSGVSILVVALGAFLPWVSIFGISKIGIEGDGVITLVLAVVAAIILVATTGLIGSERTPGRASSITLLVLAVLVALIGLIDMNGAAAIGLYLTLFGGIAWVVGAVWQLALPKSLASPVQESQGDAWPPPPAPDSRIS